MHHIRKLQPLSSVYTDLKRIVGRAIIRNFAVFALFSSPKIYQNPQPCAFYLSTTVYWYSKLQAHGTPLAHTSDLYPFPDFPGCLVQLCLVMLSCVGTSAAIPIVSRPCTAHSCSVCTHACHQAPNQTYQPQSLVCISHLPDQVIFRLRGGPLTLFYQRLLCLVIPFHTSIKCSFS